MKKSLFFVFLFVLIACARIQNGNHIAVSCKPVALIVEEITKGLIPVTTIMPDGSSPHTFSPTPKDIGKTSDAVMVIFLAGNCDYWLDLPEVEHHIEMISLLPRDLVLTDDEKKADSVTSHDGVYGDDVDPHFWLDPLCVKSIIQPLTTKIIEQFPQYSEQLLKNADAFSRRLTALADETDKSISSLHDQKVVLYHPSFRYYCKRFDLNYSGAFIEFPGKEPSPSDMNKLYGEIKAEGIRCIFGERLHEESQVKKIAGMLGIRYALLDPLGNGDGINSYFDLIKANTKIFVKELK